MNKIAFAITKALGYAENGGKPALKKPVAGKTGEMKSIFQYTPDTWRNYAGQILGNPNAPLTPDNEVHVTQGKVNQWLNQGLTPQQIFSSWNAGPGEPNAYTGKFSNGQSSVGMNRKYGVKYNVPGYVKTAMAHFENFSKEPNNSNPVAQELQPQLATNPPTPQPTQQPTQSPTGNIKGLIGSLLPQQGLLSS